MSLRRSNVSCHFHSDPSTTQAIGKFVEERNLKLASAHLREKIQLHFAIKPHIAPSSETDRLTNQVDVFEVESRVPNVELNLCRIECDSIRGIQPERSEHLYEQRQLVQRGGGDEQFAATLHLVRRGPFSREI